MARAASVGLGIALIPTFLIEAELKAGELVRISDRPLRTDAFYALTWPVERDGYPPLVAFRRWLADEMQQYRENAAG